MGDNRCSRAVYCFFSDRPSELVYKRVYDKYLTRTSTILGNLLMIFGACLIILAGIYSDVVGNSPPGLVIWNGILGVYTGSIGISAGSHKSMCAVILFFVFSCATAIMEIISWALDTVGLADDSWGGSRYRLRDRSHTGFSHHGSNMDRSLAVIGLIIVFSVIVLGLLFASIVICVITMVKSTVSKVQVPPDFVDKSFRVLLSLLFTLAILLGIGSIVIFAVSQDWYVVASDGFDESKPHWFMIWGAVLVIAFAFDALIYAIFATRMGINYVFTASVVYAITSTVMMIYSAVMIAWVRNNMNYGKNKSLYDMLAIELAISFLLLALSHVIFVLSLILYFKKTPVQENSNSRENFSPSDPPLVEVIATPAPTPAPQSEGRIWKNKVTPVDTPEALVHEKSEKKASENELKKNPPTENPVHE